MFSVTAQMCTWASVRPGMSVAPAQSIVVTGPGSAPDPPLARTSLIRSSSTITVAPSTGSAPVQSIRNALVKTVRLIDRRGGPRYGPPHPPSLGRAPAQPWRASGLTQDVSSRDHLRLVHPDLLVGARRPLHRLRHAVEVVLLPEEHPRRLVVDEPLQLGVRLRARLRIEQGLGARDLLVDRLVVAVRRVGLVGEEERLHRALAV